MFKTVKSKILAITIVMLTFLMCAFVGYNIHSRKYTKQLMVQNYKFSTDVFADDINDRITNAENNLKGLALIGNLFYRTDKNYELTDKVITRIFENYPQTLGGGIWFKPYILDKSKKYVCFYAYRDKNNKIVIDKNFASKEYDYPNQDWYKQITSQVTPERNIIWTKPYFENLGSYSMMVTAGTGIYVDGKLVGIATIDWEINSIIDELSKMKPLERTFSMYKHGSVVENSFALLANKDYDYVIATNDPYLAGKDLTGHSLKEIPWYNDNLYNITYITYHGKKYIPFFKSTKNGMVLVICVPKQSIFNVIDDFYKKMAIIILILSIIIPALLYLSLNKYVMKPINKLIDIAHKISKGEEVDIKIENPEEFAQLASTYDQMTTDIKTITKERVKINSELNIAKSIQASSLPSIFPPFPDRKEFDIYASMEPAKEVGGDFYDFFFIDETKFMFLIADVSGKGVPAALFMMTVKTLINNLSQIGYSPEQLIKIINKKICETNKQGLFVTMLLGIADVETGKTSIINCGHNLPLIKRKNGNYEYLELNSNIALGVFDDFEFEIYETILNPGDIIFTYTDGITESTNINEEMFGEERLYDCLNTIKETNVNEIAQKVKASIKEHTDSALQSDDITMLIFKYNGIQNNVKTFKQMAVQENYNQFYSWLHKACQEWNIDTDLSNKLDMCAEEIFANITFYAYPEKTGTIESELKKSDNSIIFEFRDEGIEYNPLEKPDPDITLPPGERPLGGLGIFMIKEMADEISYKRENNQNILTLVFNL